MGYGEPLPDMPAVDDAQPDAEDQHLVVHAAIAAVLALKITETDLDITDGDVPHGERAFTIPARSMELVGGTATSAPAGAAQYWVNDNALEVQSSPPMSAGDRITGASCRVRPNGVGETWTINVYKVTGYGVRTLLGTETSTTGVADETVTVDPLTAYTLQTDEYIEIDITTPSSANLGRVYSATARWTRPAP